MNLRICVGLVGIFGILLSSACTPLNNGVQPPRQKSTVGQRVERFAKSLTQTVTDVASDVLPILTATSNEIVHEMKSDVPKVVEELSTQLGHITATRGSREPGL